MDTPNTELRPDPLLDEPIDALTDAPDRAPFEVHLEPGTDHVSVRATGDIDIETAPTLAASIAAAIDDARTRGGTVRLDLREVEFIDSTGLRALLSGQADAAAAGVDLGVDGLSAAARRLLELTDTLERLRRGER